MPSNHWLLRLSRNSMRQWYCGSTCVGVRAGPKDSNLLSTIVCPHDLDPTMSNLTALGENTNWLIAITDSSSL